jgi:hypothetical protein
MTNGRQAGTALQEEQRAQTRLALGGLLVPLFFVIMFAVCIIGTYHTPHPNGVTVGVVGPATKTAAVRAGLEKVDRSAFDIRAVSTVAEAAHDVRQRDIDAAFVPTVNPRQPATVIVASAAGRIVATAAEDLVRGVTASQGAQLVVRDVRPLTRGDEIGVGVFMFMIICTIGGYLAVTILGTVAPALLERRRYLMIAAIAVLAPTLTYLIGGLGFGTYTGSVGTILAFIGVGALYTSVLGLVTRLLQVLLGPPALFVALAIFVFLNIPSLGATYTATMLPPFWRFFNHFWIGAETANTERSLLYFGGLGVGNDLLRLLAWTSVIVVLLVLPVSRKVKRERDHSAVAEVVTQPTSLPSINTVGPAF